MKKHYIKIIVFGVCLGIVLSLVREILQIPREHFLRNFYLIAAIVIAAAVVCNTLYALYYQRKIRRAIKLLEAGRPEEYLEALEAIGQKARGKALKKVLWLDLSAGYCALERYEEAIALLEELADCRGELELVRRLNLCLSYFGTKQGDKAMALYQDSGNMFASFRKRRAYGGNLAVLDMFALMEQGRCQDAEDLLKKARESWKTPALERSYQEIERMLELRRSGE